ncbi:MAG TPA: ABC transporter substrate-binding protein [Chitinophagaceae bacterium]|nr:ABC transporter substrate-binding protein [Chitinophagaceae bacterium]
MKINKKPAFRDHSRGVCDSNPAPGNRLKLRYCICIIISINILTGCRHHDYSGKQIFHYNEPTGIATLDPAFAKNQSIIWAVHQLYNTLVETDSNLTIAPSLATVWEVSADRLTYTFHLRRDVYFHDNDAFPGGRGRKLTAHDVEYSFKRITDPVTASSGAWIFNDRIDAASGFKALNDSTFQLTLLRPFNPVLGLLSMPYCSIVPKEVVEKHGKDFRSHPCGTGPFQFKAWEEGQAMILAKNPGYFEKDSMGKRLPYLDGIKISFYDSKATEFLLFRQGKLDFINDIDPSFKDEVLNKKGMLRNEWEGKIVLSKHSYLNTEYLGILTDTANPAVKSSPLRLKKLRQAINYGFDRPKMMLYLRNSIGIAAENGFVPAGLPSFNSDSIWGYTYDPVKAKQLLKEAGFPNGTPVIKLLTVPTYSDLAGFIAYELEEIGIRVQVEVVQRSLLLEQTAQSQALFFRGSWMADYPDAENYLSVFYSKNPAPPNYTRYKNPAFDKLYERSLVEQNDSMRYGLYRQMDQMIMEEAPVVPLWYDEVIRLVQPGIKGFEPNSLNLLELRRTRTK